MGLFKDIKPFTQISESEIESKINDLESKLERHRGEMVVVSQEIPIYESEKSMWDYGGKHRMYIADYNTYLAVGFIAKNGKILERTSKVPRIMYLDGYGGRFEHFDYDFSKKEGIQIATCQGYVYQRHWTDAEWIKRDENIGIEQERLKFWDQPFARHEKEARKILEKEKSPYYRYGLEIFVGNEESNLYLRGMCDRDIGSFGDRFSPIEYGALMMALGKEVEFPAVFNDVLKESRDNLIEYVSDIIFCRIPELEGKIRSRMNAPGLTYIPPAPGPIINDPSDGPLLDKAAVTLATSPLREELRECGYLISKYLENAKYLGLSEEDVCEMIIKRIGRRTEKYVKGIIASNTLFSQRNESRIKTHC